MPVTIRAAVELFPGCRLLYDCPLVGESFESRQFFDTYRGRHATFVGYSEKLVDVLDFEGRVPGRYLDPAGINVRFDGEDVRGGLNILHFVVVDTSPKHVQLANSVSDAHRLGDLPHPVLFYPGDKVRLRKDPPDTVREVNQVFLGAPFTQDDVPRYEVLESEAEAAARHQKLKEDKDTIFHVSFRGRLGSNTPGDEIILVSHGNVWALYKDPGKLSFVTEEQELDFWSKDGISKLAADCSLEVAWHKFTSGDADIIVVCRFGNSGEERYSPRRLHGCWSQHRERVRLLTEGRWKCLVEAPAA